MALGEVGDLFEEEVDMYVEVLSSVRGQQTIQPFS
jgi:hypothetical protein